MATYSDPDAWANTSDALQVAVSRAVASGNVLAAIGKTVLNTDTGTKTADGQPQTLAALIAAQVGLSQQISAQLARIEQLLQK